MNANALDRAEALSALATIRGTCSAPSRSDPHAYIAVIRYVTKRWESPPALGDLTAETHYTAVRAEIVAEAWALCQALEAAARRHDAAAFKDLHGKLDALRARCVRTVEEIDAEPFMADLEEGDTGGVREEIVLDLTRLAQVIDVCLAEAGDRHAMGRLAEAAETCGALRAVGFLRFSVGARSLLARWGEIGTCLPGSPPLCVVQRALDLGAEILGTRQGAAVRPRPTHAEMIEDDRAGLVLGEEPDPEPEPEPEPQAPGVVLIHRLGGGARGTSNREVQAEYKDVVGRAFPLYAFPQDRRALVEEAAAEAPYARRFFEELVALQDGREHWALPSFLVIGGPGGGKTTAIDGIFRRCGLHVERVACDTSSDAAAAGTPRRWSSGEINLPLRASLLSGYANPVVLWDEISRAGGHTRGSGGTLRDALTTLLEPANSSRYRDPYLEADVDISHVIHAATANSTDGIAPQVLDRLRVLRFPLPGPEHMPVLARRMALDIVRRQGLPDDHGELDRSDLRSLAEHWQGGSLRALRRFVEVAVRFRLTGPYESATSLRRPPCRRRHPAWTMSRTASARLRASAAPPSS
ncbi:AAA family ATPase, partial [Methylobacterium sp. EM32]|uniref:AAA family ATPase n=1 Tax=Methylobacterium sp. EM32 TaxID=3163481 RepID=UPI0033ABEA12